MSSNSELENSKMVGLARALADPLRLQILEALMAEPASVSELVELSGSSQSNVSNHLSVLRSSGLVRFTSMGRQKMYELAGVQAARLVESLVALSGGLAPARSVSSGISLARTCYDHLAGKLGVALFDALVAADALVNPETVDGKVGRDRGSVSLGPAAEPLFQRLGIEISEVRRERRTFASYCIDWTEHRPHLSGALGAALWRRFLQEGWVARRPGSRGVILTAGGKQQLDSMLGLEFEAAP